MKFKIIKNYLLLSLYALAIAACFAYCTPEKGGDLGSKATASFTITPVPGKVNTYALQSTSQNAFGYQWDKGNGAFTAGKANDTAYFPLKGTYTVKLRAFGRGGYDSTAQTVSPTVDDVVNDPNFKLLIAKKWKLDPAGASSIVVGTDANPSQYFGGGPLADCQLDDYYTFSADLKLTYNSGGSTFNGGNLAPNFSCGSDRSYSGVSFLFDPRKPSTGAGIASITLAAPVPTNFIGVTDVSSNNYRIISISANSMVLRSGTPTETVHQFKFVGF